MKKGQAQQVFIYLMVIIVVGALLLVGYRSIDNIMSRGDEVEMARFKSDLLNDLDRTTSHGTVRNVDYRMSGVGKLCFANQVDGGDSPVFSIISNEVGIDDNNNVFLFEGDILVDAFRFENLYEYQSIVCINSSNNRFSFVMRGERGEVKVLD